MFGYIRINEQELKVREAAKYRSYYCGLCDRLHKLYGRKGQALLSYDMTFLVLLLDGLYEPEETEKKTRCVVHPARRHLQTVCPVTDYAADMTLLLSFQKGADDWADEKKAAGRMATVLLKKDYDGLREKYPRQSRALEQSIRRLRYLEKQYAEGMTWTDIDAVSAVSGRFMGEILAMEDDIWKRDLRQLGFYLGKTVYLMDAYEDMQRDEKNGSFNPLLLLKQQDTAAFEAELDALLEGTMACAARIFERLPIVRNVEVLRNILYSGIWTRYVQVKQKRTEQNGKDN